MTKRKFNRAILGDIAEIPLKQGFAYIQYVYNYKKPPNWGALVRVFPGIYSSRLHDFKKLNQMEERFVAFFPIRTAVHRNLMSVVAHEMIPPKFATLPLFKGAGARDTKTGNVRIWWLWDGDKSWRVGKLTRAQKRLPIHEIINFPLLVERIETNWSPEDEVVSASSRS
jgi:hypothetical protein